jgi:hypothetical protein
MNLPSNPGNRLIINERNSGNLVQRDNRRVVDAQFGVHHFSSTVCETHQLSGSKGSLVKRHSHCRVIYDDVRRRSTLLVGGILQLPSVEQSDFADVHHSIK